MDRFIDLTHRIADGLPAYPGDPPVSLKQTHEIASDHFCAFHLSTGMHAGTHIDAPSHLIAGPAARSIDAYPMDAWVGRGVLLDARGQDPIDWSPAFEGKLMAGDIVLIHTGWDDRFGEEAYFTEHPSLTERMVDHLLSAEVKLLGLDTPSPDQMPFIQHKRILRQGVPIAENLTNLSALLRVGAFEVYAIPLRIAAEGSLARVFARG